MKNYNNYGAIKHFLIRMCHNSKRILNALKGFSQGIGYGDDITMCVFADDPDENDPVRIRDYPELIGIDGVGFFSKAYDEPLIVSYQVFYDELKKKIFESIDKNAPEYEEILKYLELIKQRYNLKD